MYSRQLRVRFKKYWFSPFTEKKIKLISCFVILKSFFEILGKSTFFSKFHPKMKNRWKYNEFSIFRKKIGLARRYLIRLKILCFWTWDYEKISTSTQHCIDCVLRLQYRFKSGTVEKPLFMFKNSLFSPERAVFSEFFHEIKAAIKCMTLKIDLGLNYKPLDTFW